MVGGGCGETDRGQAASKGGDWQGFVGVGIDYLFAPHFSAVKERAKKSRAIIGEREESVQ